MAVLAKIKFVQGVNVGVPGISLIGTTAAVVTASDGLAGQNDPVRTYRWTWIDVPTGSAIPVGLITSGAVTSITFTPDVAGDYELMLEAYGLDGKRYVDRRVFRVLNADGLPLPSFTGDKDSLNFGGRTTGWKLDMEAWFAFFGGGGGGGSGGGAAARPIEAVAATPGWYVIGSFYALEAASVDLEMLGCVSDPGLTMNGRMYDVTAKAVVAGSAVAITAQVDGRAVSSAFSLVVGHQYQMQAECVGGTGFGVVTSMNMGAP